jgi:hypothetical protein
MLAGQEELAGRDACGTFQEVALCCSYAKARRGGVLLAAEQSGWEDAATNVHSALRTPILQKTIRKDQPGEGPQRAGGGHGSVCSPGLAHPWRVRLLTLGEGANGASGCTQHSRKTHAKTTMQTTRDEGTNKIFHAHYTCCCRVCQAACGTAGPRHPLASSRTLCSPPLHNYRDGIVSPERQDKRGSPPGRASAAP